MNSSVSVGYKKEDEAKKVTITISSEQPLGMLDVLRALTSIMTQILNSGKY